MKVCYVLASKGGIGGLEKHVKELALGMQKKGVDVCIIGEGVYEDFFKGVPFVSFSFGSRWNILNYWRLFQILKRVDPDIIHAHATKATHFIVSIKRYLHSKVVATVHGLKTDLSIYQKADCVIAVSKRVLETISHPKKYLIYNGISRKETSLKTKKKDYICAVGRFVHVKGFDILIEAMKLLPHRRLMLIGDGSKNVIEQARKLDNIELSGFLPSQEVMKRIAEAKLVVIPSRKEGFSYVLLESLFCYTPVIATDFADVKDFIPREWIVPLNAKSIADTIEMFMQEYEKNFNDYLPYFQHAQEECSFERMVERTMKVYQEVQR